MRGQWEIHRHRRVFHKIGLAYCRDVIDSCIVPEMATRLSGRVRLYSLEISLSRQLL